MKRLLLLLIIPMLSFGQREVITKKEQEINNIFVLTDNRNTGLIDNRFEVFDIEGSVEKFLAAIILTKIITEGACKTCPYLGLPLIFKDGNKNYE